MTFGIIAGVLDTTKIGASYIGSLSYSPGQVINEVLPAFGAKYMGTFTYLVIPAAEFSPFTVMVLPAVSLAKAATGVLVQASGGNAAVRILIFGR